MTLKPPPSQNTRNANTSKNGHTQRDEPACCMDGLRDFDCDCCGAETAGYPTGDTWAACYQCGQRCTIYKPCDRWRI